MYIKKISLIIAITITAISVVCSQEETVTENYSRSAVTLKLLDFREEAHRDRLRNDFRKMTPSAKFDNNNLDSQILKADLSEDASMAKKERIIKQKLEEQKTANKIIAKWFNRQPDGTMNMELIHKRGLYNAVDADVKKAEASKRGKAMLMDMGLKLLDKTYIVVIDYTKIQGASQAGMTSELHGWRTYIDVYLYRVKYDDEAQAKLFREMWIYSDDDEETRQKKKEMFDNHTFGVEHVMTQTSPMPVDRMQFDDDNPLGKLIEQKSNRVLFKEMVAKGIERAFFLLEKNHPDFRVKMPLSDDRPLKSKMGEKEGLKVDQRYFVYEYKYNPNTKKAEPNRKGVVRAKEVADNREVASGEMPTSQFYQIYGGNLEKGMLLQQKNDWGIAIQGRAWIGQVGGGGARVSYNLAKLTKSPQLKVYGYFAFDSKNYEINDQYLNQFGSQEYQFGFLRGGIGFSKGFYFARMFSLEPFVDIAYETAFNGDLEYQDLSLVTDSDVELDDMAAFNTIMFDLGADFGIHITYWMKLIAGAELHIPTLLLDNESKPYQVSAIDPEPIQYSDFFADRNGISYNIGLHVEF